MQAPYAIELIPSAAMFEGQENICRNFKHNTAIATAS